MGRLTTHILDTVTGKPAANVEISLWQINQNDHRILVSKTRTNSDGRTNKPLLSDDDYKSGCYELVFHMCGYFSDSYSFQSEHPFLGNIPVRFSIHTAEEHYHVPLLVSPHAYSTYRGS